MTSAAKNIITLLTLLLVGSGAGVWQIRSNYLRKVKQQSAAHSEELGRQHLEMQTALTAQAEKHQQQLSAINAEHEKRITAIQNAQREQMAAAYREFEDIFEGNKKTADYLSLIEAKVKQGREVTDPDVERLKIIASGLGYLQKQYTRPLEEFSELAEYFEKQAVLQPEKPRANFFRRTFSREYRERERQYYRDEGARQAFEQAQNKFASAYASAQKQMAAIRVNTDEQIKKLQAFIDDKEAAKPADLTSFFDQARKALRTHQDVLKFEPENLPLPPQPPRP